MTILMLIVSCIGGDSENRGFKFSSWVIKYILTIFHHLHLYLFNCSMCYNPHFSIFLTFVFFVCLFSTQIPQLLCLHLVQVSLLLKLSKHCFGLLVLFLLFVLSLVFLTSFCYFWYCFLFWGAIRHFFKQHLTAKIIGGILWIVTLETSFSHPYCYLIAMNSFFYKIKIIYFISHEGYIPASEAPNLIDPPPLGMYTVVFFVCLFACFFPEEKNTNKPTEMKTLIHIWMSVFISLFCSTICFCCYCSPSYRLFQMINALLITLRNELWTKFGFIVKSIWRFFWVMHMKKTLECNRCLNLNRFPDWSF